MTAKQTSINDFSGLNGEEHVFESCFLGSTAVEIHIILIRILTSRLVDVNFNVLMMEISAKISTKILNIMFLLIRNIYNSLKAAPSTGI